MDMVTIGMAIAGAPVCVASCAPMLTGNWDLASTESGLVKKYISGDRALCATNVQVEPLLQNEQLVEVKVC